MDSYWAHNFGDRGLNPHDLSHQVTIGASAETQWQQQERGIAELVRWNMKPWGFPCWLVVEPYPSENIFPTEWKIIIQSCSSHHQAAKPWGFPLFWSNESMNLQIFPHFHISPGRFSRFLQSPGLVSSFQPSRRRSFFQCPQQSSRDPGGMAPWRELSGIFFCIFFAQIFSGQVKCTSVCIYQTLIHRQGACNIVHQSYSFTINMNSIPSMWICKIWCSPLFKTSAIISLFARKSF